MSIDPTQESSVASDAHAVRTVAVIDIGTTSIRMAVAEITENSSIRVLEHLSQAVNIGKDTFTRGSIRRRTIEQCVGVLQSYQQILSEYQISDSEDIHVVATSAVRESDNSLAFVDRIYIATGLIVDVIDAAEASRITFLGVQYELSDAITNEQTVMCEVGGGSTELIIVENSMVSYSHTFRLGAMRLREAIDSHSAAIKKSRRIMESQIRRTLESITEHINGNSPHRLLALGGDIRFATTIISKQSSTNQPRTIKTKDLRLFTDKILTMSTDDIVADFDMALTYPEAETLGPALLSYVVLADLLGIDEIVISQANLRDGLLREMAQHEGWISEFQNHVVGSALDLGRKYGFDELHAIHVADLSRTLFQQLQSMHQLDARFETILYAAALLHEIGLFVSNNSYHKHTMYLINNSELFGMGKTNLMLIALVARYHRRASPQPKHEGYENLDRDERVAVAKLAAILRIAITLDASRSQRIRNLKTTITEQQLVITTSDSQDLSLEQLAITEQGNLFNETFGMKVLLSEPTA